MPFGLRNALSTFRRPMDVPLSAAICESAIVSCKDIVSFSRSPAEHIGHVKNVCTLLSEAGVTLKLKNGAS